MPTVDWKILAAGQVANSQGVIYTATEQVCVKSALFAQTSATPQDLVVWLKKAAGTARRIAQADDLPQGYKLEVADKDIYMGAGDTLEAATTTAAVVDFTVRGGERVP